MNMEAAFLGIQQAAAGEAAPAAPNGVQAPAQQPDIPVDPPLHEDDEDEPQAVAADDLQLAPIEPVVAGDDQQAAPIEPDVGEINEDAGEVGLPVPGQVQVPREADEPARVVQVAEYRAPVCAVCRVEIATHLFQCDHLCICNDCAASLRQRGLAHRCILCRQESLAGLIRLHM